MWRSEEENAIRIGLDLEYFWKLNPKQYMKHIHVFNEKEKMRVQEADKLNHMLAYYIAYGINDPKHFPKEPLLSEKKKIGVMSDNEMEAIAMMNSNKLKRGR